MKHTITSALAFIALSATSALAGTATIRNQCGFPIYVWSVIVKSGTAPMQTIESGNSTSEEYRVAPEGGVSMKVGMTDDQSKPAQFEYTIGADTIFYDLSLIDGNPFGDHGMIMTPSDSSCFTVDCPPGQYCADAYQHPDDVCTHGCKLSADVTLTVCPGLGGSSGGSSGSSSPAPSSSAAPAPTPTSSPEPEVAVATSSPPPAVTSAAPTAAAAEASPTEEAAPQELAEAPEEEPEATPTAPTWHSVSKRRGHNHGHRFARP